MYPRGICCMVMSIIMGITSLGADAHRTPSTKSLSKKEASKIKTPKGADRVKKTLAPGMRTAVKTASLPKTTSRGRISAPAAGANGPEIYGTIAFSPNLNQGLYAVPTNSSEDFEMIFPLMAIDANYGGAAKDGVYYLNNYYNLMDFLIYYESYGYDIATGEEVYYADLSDNLSILCPGGMALDPTTNEIYGISFTEDLKGQQLAKITYTDPLPTKTVIADLNDWYVAFAIDSDGQFYAIREGIGGQGILCKLNRQTGESTIIGNTGQYPYYNSGACIDARTNRMYWTVSPEDQTGFLTEVNLSTGVATVIYNFPANEEVNGLFIPLPQAEEEAPAACTDVRAEFSADALSGSVTFVAPAVSYGGTPLNGKLNVSLMINGELKETKTELAPGTSGSFDVTVSAAGAYTFTVYSSNSTGDGPKTTLENVWIGADSPAATTATAKYANGNVEITWLPVTSGLNGGYIDTSDLSYTVKDASGNILAEGITVTSYSFKMDLPSQITNYYYEVYTVVGNLVSPPARTNTLVLGSIMPPYSPNLSATGLAGWTIIDANNDGSTWTLEPDGSLKADYNSFNPMDDWIISPSITLEGGKSYNVAFEARSYSDFWEERFEVKWGDNNTVEAMINTVTPPTDIASENFVPFSKMITPDKDGLYYIGFHGISEADQFYLYIANIQVEAGAAITAPGFASNLTASQTRSASGWDCTVAFNAPTLTVNGDALQNISKIDLIRNGTLIHTFKAPTPGESLTHTDVNAPTGETNYTLIPYNEGGEGLRTSIDTFIGQDLPAAPEAVLISRTSTDGEVLLTWQPVLNDIHGTAIEPEEVTYVVSIYKNGWEPVAENLTGTSYTCQAVPSGQQDFVQMSVFAKTSAGTSQGTVSRMIPAGTPYTGLNETFAQGKLHYAWNFTPIVDASVSVNTDSTYEGIIASVTGDGGYLSINAPYDDYGAIIGSGLISLDKMDSAGLTFYTYNIDNGEDADINELSVEVKEADSDEWTILMPPTSIETLCRGKKNDWSKIILPLAAYANKTIEVRITAVTKFYTNTFLDDIVVGSVAAHDLAAIAIDAPAKADAGESFSIEVTVENDGTATADAYSVELYADNSLISTLDANNLTSGGTTNLKFDVLMSAIATEPVSYYAQIIYNPDQNIANNQTPTIKVTPIVSILPTATDLSGENQKNSIKLSWNAPDLGGGIHAEVTDDFEDAEGIMSKYGDWKFYDGDGSPVGGFDNMDIPGITVGSTKGSFWIWDNEVIGGNQTFEAHSGNHFLFALFRYDDGQTDDWAISPELYGGKQTVSFYARSYSSDYPEKIQVYYSTGSQDVNDFVAIGSSYVNSVPAAWTRYICELPEGAKYFAIRSFASGSFMLMIDDVSYTPAKLNTDIQISGYNVYRNGEKINDTLAVTNEYTDNYVNQGEQYRYVVTVVYDNGHESAPSRELIIIFSPTDGIDTEALPDINITVENRNVVILNAEGMNIAISDISGASHYAGKGEQYMVFEVTPGIYLIKAGEKTAKVMVK